MKKFILFFVVSFFFIAAVSAMGLVTKGGNVGIGTDNPQTKLVIGDTTANQWKIGIAGGGNVGDWRGIAFTDANGGTAYGGIKFVNDAGSDSSLQFLTWAGTPGGTEQMVIKGISGNVGIGTNNPQAKLDVNGNVRAASFVQTSDARLKNVFGEFNSKLNSVMALNPVKFEYKNDLGKTHVGFIAQDVQKVIPEAISIDGNGYLSIDNTVLIASLVNAVQEQQKEIEQLKQKCK